MFIGAFNNANLSVRGGQLAACTSLLESPLAQSLDLVLLDTTQISVPPPSLPTRARFALCRIAKAMKILLFGQIDALLIFCANGASFLEKGCVVIVARILGKRVVLARRSGYLVDEYRRSIVWRFLIRMVLRAASVLICQGAVWKCFFVRAGADSQRCVIIKNWIRAPELAQLPTARRPTRDLHVLYLGWIEREKGLFDLLTAIEMVVKSGRPTRVLIAGEGSASADLNAEIKRLGLDRAVMLFGWVGSSQRRELLCTSHVLVMPSHSEGLPNALLEGMVAGRAVVSTCVGAVPDVIRDGHNGLLVNVSDAKSIAEALIRLHDNPELLEKIAVEARRTVLVEHDLDVAAWQLLKALTGRESGMLDQ